MKFFITEKPIDKDVNNNDIVLTLPFVERFRPIDYTYIAIAISVPVPFLGIPAVFYSRMCCKEAERGNISKAWQHSWMALYFILSGLVFLGLIFLGAFLLIILDVNSKINQPVVAELPQTGISLATTVPSTVTSPRTHQIHFERFLKNPEPLRNATSDDGSHQLHVAHKEDYPPRHLSG